MDHSTRELRKMLRGMGVEFSDDDTYEELKELFHKETTAAGWAEKDLTMSGPRAVPSG